MANQNVVSMKSLLEAGVHFGHQTRRWNPKMAPYIYTERNGIYIIDLQKTVKKLEEAYAFVRQLSENGQTLLFVGTIAEGQHGVDVLLGDVARGDAGPDAAAIGDGRVHLSAVLSAPQTRASQIRSPRLVSSVRLPGSFSPLRATSVFGKHGAVIVVDLLLNLGGPGGHVGVRRAGRQRG